jgi:hypothetical protein
MLQQATLKRLEKGLLGAASGAIKIVSRMTGTAPDDSTVILWEIFSRQSNPKGTTYFVGYKPATAEWRCTCPDFAKRGHQMPCKHILLAQVEYQQRVEG